MKKFPYIVAGLTLLFVDAASYQFNVYAQPTTLGAFVASISIILIIIGVRGAK